MARAMAVRKPCLLLNLSSFDLLLSIGEQRMHREVHIGAPASTRIADSLPLRSLHREDRKPPWARGQPCGLLPLQPGQGLALHGAGLPSMALCLAGGIHIQLE